MGALKKFADWLTGNKYTPQKMITKLTIFQKRLQRQSAKLNSQARIARRKAVEFRKKGDVKKGKSYIHTTKLVDTGIYSVVRHPQYVTFIMWAIAGMFLFQHWIVILLGIPVIPLIYIDLIKADKKLIKKFGDDYKAYMKRVPRGNFLLGIIRLLGINKKKIK